MAGVGQGKASGWVQAALAVGVGKSLAEAAALSDCSERTVRRWLAESLEFQGKVEEVHRMLMTQVVGKLGSTLTKAVETLENSLQDGNVFARNQAASRLAELFARFRHQETMVQKLAVLQELVDRLKEEHPEWFKLDGELSPEGEREPA